MNVMPELVLHVNSTNRGVGIRFDLGMWIAFADKVTLHSHCQAKICLA